MVQDALIGIPAPHGWLNAAQSLGRISFSFYPRLGDDRGSRLDDWPGWSEWPTELLGGITFDVTVNGESLVEDPAPPNGLPRQNRWVVRLPTGPQVWNSIFVAKANTIVRPFRFQTPIDDTGDQIRTVPEARAAATIAEIRDAVATAFGDTTPTAAQVRELVGPQLANLPRDQVRRFLRPDAAMDRPDPEDVEFHSALTLLRRHPFLARELGLTVEFVVNLSDDTRFDPDDKTWDIDIRTNWAGLRAGRKHVYAAVDVDTRDFWPPNEDDSIVVDEHLDLQDGRFMLTYSSATTDTLNLAAIADMPDDEPVTSFGAPANAGIGLYFEDQGAQVKSNLLSQRAFNAALEGALYGPDVPPPPAVPMPTELLAAAYRVDVAETDDQGAIGTPRSLFAREAPDGYATGNPNLTLIPPADEGWLGTVMATPGGAVPPRLGERIATWLGWSLVAEPIGTLFDPATGEAVPRTPNVPEPTSPIQFGVDYQVPDGSLPRLRFDATYVMRARVVDIAGNSRAVDDLEGAIWSRPFTYRRPDDVLPPLIVRRSPRPVPVLKGDTTGQIVLRSQVTQDDATVPAQERMLLPPINDPKSYELHEQPVDLIHTAEGYQQLALHDPKRQDDLLVVDPASGEAVAGTASGGAVLPGPVRPLADYLPDPAIVGVSVFGGEARNTVTAAFFPRTSVQGPLVDPDDVRLHAQRLVVQAGDQPATATAFGIAPGMTVNIPKACVEDLFISCTPKPEENLTRMASATFRVIHAIPNGRFVPGFPGASAGDRRTEPELITKGLVSAQMRMDVPATGRAVLRGRWTDLVDDVTQPGPIDITKTAVLGSDDIDYVKEGEQQSVDVLYDFGDSIRHDLTVQGKTIARFTPYFVEAHAVDFDGTPTVILEPEGGIVENTFTLRRTDRSKVFRRDVDYTLDAEAGSITRLQDGAISGADQLEADYAPGPNTLSTTDGPSPTATVIVPNATFPPPPDVTAVQPAYRRRMRRRWGSLQVRSDGRILRVRLARPWNVTGNEETLAVQLDTSDAEIPRWTRFAREAITASGGSTQPTTATFPDGFADTASLVAFVPTYDVDRNDWVCDLTVAATTYRPLIRLALVRYQPESVLGRAASQPVLLDEVRLGVLRDITVTPTGQATVAVQVVGVDHTGRLGAGGGLRFNSVVVTVQEADATISDPDLRWQTTGTVVTLSRAAGATSSTWSGDVVLPPATGPLRLLIEELEPVVRDDGSGGAVDDGDLVMLETVVLPQGVSGAGS